MLLKEKELTKARDFHQHAFGTQVLSSWDASDVAMPVLPVKDDDIGLKQYVDALDRYRDSFLDNRKLECEKACNERRERCEMMAKGRELYKFEGPWLARTLGQLSLY